MGERTPAETAFLHFLSALRLFAAARAFPHVTGIFLIVVSPDCASTAFRCRFRLLWQKSLLYRITALKYIIPRAQRAHLPLPPQGGKGAI